MKERSAVVALMLVLAVLLACKKKEQASPVTVSTSTSTGTTTGGTATGTTGDKAEAQALLEKFLAPGADYASLTAALEPSSADYTAVFGADAAKAETYYTKMWKDPNAKIKPNAGQTQLLLFGTTTDLVSKDREFPGGYSKVRLQGKFPIYRWKFVERGKTLGMAYDGLVFVNGHFAFFPKPWRVGE